MFYQDSIIFIFQKSLIGFLNLDISKSFFAISTLRNLYSLTGSFNLQLLQLQ